MSYVKQPWAREHVQMINEARRAQQEDVGTDHGPVEDNDGPQVAGEATSAMNDVLDLHHNNEGDGHSLEELVQSLNTDQARVYKHVKSHLETHEKKQCSCTDLKPLHMFVSWVGGTGKSFLIKTVRALVTKMWENETQSTLCRHCWTGSIQRRCSHHPPTAAAAYSAQGQRSWLLEASESW